MQPKDKTTLKELPLLMLKGFLMGSADIVPGVSGGTMALITGIYERLLAAIGSFNAQSIKAFLTAKFRLFFEQFHWLFFMGLFAGIGSAVIFFTRIVPLPVYMYQQPELVYGLFFGLILGSIWILTKDINGWNAPKFVSLLLGAAIGFWIVNLVPADTPEHPAFVFLSGMIAICAMILPGISGSYLLLMMRKYEFILSQISALGGPQSLDALLILLPFTLGALAGIMLFSRFLGWLLNRYHQLTMCVLIGFLVGSLYMIWPYQHRDYVRIEKQTVLEAGDPLVAALRQQAPDTLHVPRFSYLKTTKDNAKVLVEVKMKQRSVQPYLPTKAEIGNDFSILLMKGLGGSLLGLLLVIGIERMRKTSA